MFSKEGLRPVQKTNVRNKGREIESDVLRILNLELLVTGAVVRTCRLKDEWYQDLHDPKRLIEAVLGQPVFADILTFIERPPVIRGRELEHYSEFDNVAAIELQGYDHWWGRQINSKTRALVRKAQKSGVAVAVVGFDDALLTGIERIYNETPIRQGKPFWHYRKDRDYLRRLHETYIDRADFVGAYFEDQLIGFVKLVYAGGTANTMHIISMNEHRDKAVNNALIAKAVEVCSLKQCTHIVYDKFDYETGGSATLQQFKRNNGFERLEYPRYYVPITWTGRMALRLGAQRGIVPMLPRALVETLVNLRNQWHIHKHSTNKSQV